MEAGVDLDARVSEQIMGVPVRWEERVTGWRVAKIEGKPWSIPNYSTDISAALPILEMFRERGPYKIVISAYAKDEFWTIKAYHPDGAKKSCTTSAKTLAHAICLAALKAVEK